MNRHTHPHTHEHAHTAHPIPGGALGAALALTMGYAVVEALGGLWAGSLTLLGDAGHMITDAVALGFASIAAWLSARPPSLRHSYGLGRAEIIAALLNALLMLIVVASIATEAWTRLHAPAPVRGGTVIVVAGMGLLVNAVVAYVLSRGSDTLNVRAAMLHVIGDMLGSVAALAAGFVIYLTGWTPIDPILALVVCLLILYSTYHLLRESLHVMMEGVPLHIDLDAVGRAMAGVENVVSVHDLHIWTLSSGKIALSAHVVMKALHPWEPTLAALNYLLHERYGIEHTTLQPETRRTTFIMHRMHRHGAPLAPPDDAHNHE